MGNIRRIWQCWRPYCMLHPNIIIFYVYFCAITWRSPLKWWVVKFPKDNKIESIPGCRNTSIKKCWQRLQLSPVRWVPCWRIKWTNNIMWWQTGHSYMVEIVGRFTLCCEILKHIYMVRIFYITSIIVNTFQTENMNVHVKDIRMEWKE